MVIARLEPRVIPTYGVGAPEKNPVFCEKRVYQGSCGKVYPVPFIDKVFDQKTPIAYLAALLENEYVRLVMLPEIGGRIFSGQDKTNDDYDFFYRQDVIKPALVGLAGPWISGGVEFNWPQHHRPGTFMPSDVSIEEEPDGARTIWMSEHDPMFRLKGMHGVRLRPDSSLVELRVRLYNRTPFVQTFLWWANAAVRVHDQYQSFFPPDVHYVADHAVRAMSSFPIADNPYYGIDYQHRSGANDLTWYKNIPVPTSYMICETAFDFFGGYDFAKHGGFVHVANRHIAPGKKQWTWGNDRFGWSWDRELTDDGGPYIELMSGVYTDNQPDFSYLAPYETRTFSHFWWPIRDIGPVQQANERAALACKIRSDRRMELGLCVSRKFIGKLTVVHGDRLLLDAAVELGPGQSWMNHEALFPGENASELKIEILEKSGERVLTYRPVERERLVRHREVATEPLGPSEVASNDELFLVGEHLDQYRHPTRDPEDYWREAIARDPGDSRCHVAMAKRALQHGQFQCMRDHCQLAVRRLTRRHPNPITGEAHYHLGLAHRWLGDEESAYAAFYKSTWNAEWRSPAYYQLATLDCRRRAWSSAVQHLELSRDTNRQHNKTFVLQALVLHHARNEPWSRSHDAPKQILASLRLADPLDHWAAHVALLVDETTCAESWSRFLKVSRNDAQTILDLAFDYVEAGFYEIAAELLELHHDQDVADVAVPNPLARTAMTHYLLAWLKHQMGATDADAALRSARNASADHFFPSRLEEMMVLQWALDQPGSDQVAAYGLGNLLFDRRRHEDALHTWQRAVEANSSIPQVYRNLAIAVWNLRRDGDAAAGCYRRAMEIDSRDARLVSEYDQLAMKRNLPLAERLAFLEEHRELVLQRDDATIQLAALYNLTGQPQQALDLVMSRRFHPWEGGEGAVLRQYTTARLLLGQSALERGDGSAAYGHFSLAMDTPETLGEAYHPLQAKADVNYWTGRSLLALGRNDEARDCFQESADESADFTAMAVTPFSPLTYYRGMSLRELGQTHEADELFRALLKYARAKLGETANIDYFATSLPNLLVFDEDLQARRDAEHRLLIALAHAGLGESDAARTNVDAVLGFDRSDQHAVNLSQQLERKEANGSGPGR